MVAMCSENSKICGKDFDAFEERGLSLNIPHDRSLDISLDPALYIYTPRATFSGDVSTLLLDLLLI